MKNPPTTVDLIAKTCIAVRLRMLNRVVTNLYDDALRPLGLKVSQMNVLVVAAKVGVVKPTQVCDYLQLDVSTVSRNVERMRARGWLEVVSGDDARTQSFRLTAPGKRLLDKSIPAWEKCSEKPKKCWVLKELSSSIKLLRRSAACWPSSRFFCGHSCIYKFWSRYEAR